MILNFKIQHHINVDFQKLTSMWCYTNMMLNFLIQHYIDVDFFYDKTQYEFTHVHLKRIVIFYLLLFIENYNFRNLQFIKNMRIPTFICASLEIIAKYTY